MSGETALHIDQAAIRIWSVLQRISGTCKANPWIGEAGVPLEGRTDTFLRRTDVRRLSDLVEMPFAEIVSTRGVGVTTVWNLIDIVEDLIILAIERNSDSIEVAEPEVRSLQVEATRKDTTLSPVLQKVKISELPLGTRARQFLEIQYGCRTLGDFSTLVSASVSFVADSRNVGIETVREVEDLASILQDDEQVRAWLLGMDSSPPDFVSWVDRVLGEKDSKLAVIIRERFTNGRTLGDIGDDLGLSRERIRQLEPNALMLVRRAAAAFELDAEEILEDEVIEIEELCTEARNFQHPAGVYTSLARLSLTPIELKDLFRFYGDLAVEVAQHLKGMPAFLLGRLKASELIGEVKRSAPALMELPADQLWSTVLDAANARLTADRRVVGERFRLRPSIRALIGMAGGTARIKVLHSQMTQAALAHSQLFKYDVPQLRNIIREQPGLRLLDATTVTSAEVEEGLAAEWITRFMDYARIKAKPVSLVSFLAEQEDSPFDTDGLSAIVGDVVGVYHVGRYLYSTNSDDEGRSFEVAGIIDRILDEDPGPWMLGELTARIRSHRQLVSGQIDGYLSKVQNMTWLGSFAVVRGSLDREGQLRLLSNEAFVRRRMRDVGLGADSAAVSELWDFDLLGETPDLNREETEDIVRLSAEWDVVEAFRNGKLFFRRKWSRS